MLINTSLQQAVNLMQTGRAAEAEQVCQTILKQMPAQPDALHMLAMIARQREQHATAEAYFKQSLDAKPDQPAVLGNYANLLLGLARYDEAIDSYKKAVQLDPSFVNGWYNLALAHRSLEQYEEAKQAALRAKALAPGQPAIYEILGGILHQLSDINASKAAYLEGLNIAPQNARLWCQYGVLLKEEAEFKPAGEAFARAVGLGLQLPEVYQSLAEAYYEQGDVRKAQDTYDEAIRQFPKDPQSHFIRAKFWWETGHEEDHLKAIKEAIQKYPGEPHLWGAYFDLLSHEARFSDMLRHLKIAREHCEFIPRLRLTEAQALSAEGHEEEATRAFEALMEIDPEGAPPRLAFAEHLLKNQNPERADRVCGEVLARNPYDQTALVMQGTAWELMDDPRAKWLLDYERMVMPVDVPIPEGWGSREAYFEIVREELEKMHQMQAHPLDQTLRGGTQTNGFIFRLKNPVLQELRQQIQLAIQSVLKDFPVEQEHPFWGRHIGGFEFKGAWSVRLKSQGFHTNHFHPEGWFSSALYVALPDVVAGESNMGHQGHIQFGVPTAEMGLDVQPKRIIRPEVGRLVLFPSYMWHGTIPFESEDPRITIAFDFTPKAV